MIDYNSVLSDKIKKIKPSGIRRFFDLAQNMQGVISLGVGEPDFQTPWVIRKSAIDTLEKKRMIYSANAGLAQLREEIASLSEDVAAAAKKAQDEFASVGSALDDAEKFIEGQWELNSTVAEVKDMKSDDDIPVMSLNDIDENDIPEIDSYSMPGIDYESMDLDLPSGDDDSDEDISEGVSESFLSDDPDEDVPNNILDDPEDILSAFMYDSKKSGDEETEQVPKMGVNSSFGLDLDDLAKLAEEDALKNGEN